MFRWGKGRVNRQTYWTLLLLTIGLYLLLAAFVRRPPAVAEILLIALGIPRLHDIGRSGWWMALPIGLEIVAIALSLIFLPISDLLIVGGAVVFAMAIMLAVLGVIKGDSAANKYGEAPAPGYSFSREVIGS